MHQDLAKIHRARLHKDLVKSQSYKNWDLAQMDSHLDDFPKVLVFLIPLEANFLRLIYPSLRSNTEELERMTELYCDICRWKRLQQTLGNKSSDTRLRMCMQRRDGSSCLRVPLQISYPGILAFFKVTNEWIKGSQLHWWNEVSVEPGCLILITWSSENVQWTETIHVEENNSTTHLHF